MSVAELCYDLVLNSRSVPYSACQSRTIQADRDYLDAHGAIWAAARAGDGDPTHWSPRPGSETVINLPVLSSDANLAIG